jgi:hypothetical protein
MMLTEAMDGSGGAEAGDANGVTKVSDEADGVSGSSGSPREYGGGGVDGTAGLGGSSLIAGGLLMRGRAIEPEKMTRGRGMDFLAFEQGVLSHWV